MDRIGGSMLIEDKWFFPWWSKNVGMIKFWLIDEEIVSKKSWPKITSEWEIYKYVSLRVI